MTSAVHLRTSRAIAGLLAAAGLALAGCGDPATAGDGGGDSGGHDHGGSAPAAVEAPEDRYAGLDLAEPYRRPTFTLTDTTGAAYDLRAVVGAA